MNTESFLKALDLNEKESATYLALLELGESTIVPLAKKTCIIRTTLLYVLDKLKEKGLIEIVQHPTHRRYAPLPPRHLLTLIKQKEAKLDEQAKLIEQYLPDLNRLYSTTPFQPRIRVYQGAELREIYEEMITLPIDEVLYVGSTTEIVGAVGDNFMRDWIKRRATKGIHSKAIRIRSGEQEAPEYIGEQTLLRTIRYAPDGLESPAVIYIYGDNVAVITTATESFGVVTTSRDYAVSMRGWFKQLWKISSER